MFKPPATILTSPVRIILPMLRKMLPSQRSTEIEKKLENNSNKSASVSFLHIIRKLVLAYERKKFCNLFFAALLEEVSWFVTVILPKK